MPGLIDVDTTSAFWRGLDRGMAVSDQADRRNRLDEEMAFRRQQANRAEDQYQRGIQQDQADRFAQSDMYNQEVLGPQLLDASSGTDLAGFTDQVNQTMQRASSFRAASPETQRSMMNPQLADQRRLRAQGELLRMKQAYMDDIRLGKMRTIIASSMPDDEKDRALLQLETGYLSKRDSDPLTLDEFRALPMYGQLDPDQQVYADSYVQASGKMPPWGAIKPHGQNGPTINLSPSKNPMVNMAAAQVRQATIHLNTAQRLAMFSGDTSIIEQAQREVDDAFMEYNRVVTEQGGLAGAGPTPPPVIDSAQPTQGPTPNLTPEGGPDRARQAPPQPGTPTAGATGANDPAMMQRAQQMLPYAKESFQRRFGRPYNPATDREAMKRLLVEMVTMQGDEGQAP